MREYATYGGLPPNPRQKIFHEIKPWRGSLFKGAIGGLGGGKSRACEEEQIMRCSRTPGGVSMAMRFSIEEAKSSLVSDYKRYLQGFARWLASESCFVFPNGHHLYVIPGSKFDRFGSVELVSFYIQEAQECKFEVFDALSQRLRHPAGLVNGVPYWCGMFDARGVSTKHWIHKDFISQAWNVDTDEKKRQFSPNPSYAYVKFSTLDNREYLEKNRPGYIESLVRNHKHDKRWQRVFIHGETGTEVEGEPVFPDFDPDRHVGAIEIDQNQPILRGVDFGFRNPAVVWFQYHRDGRLVALRELCPTNIRQEDLHVEVEALQRNEFPRHAKTEFYDFVDVAGEQETATASVTQIEMWQNHFGTSPESSKRLLKDGHEVIRKLMTSFRKLNGTLVPRFMVDSSCETLIAALAGGYCFKRKDDGTEVVEYDNPYKKVVDTVRYVAQVVAAGDGENYFGVTNPLLSGDPTLAVY